MAERLPPQRRAALVRAAIRLLTCWRISQGEILEEQSVLLALAWVLKSAREGCYRITGKQPRMARWPGLTADSLNNAAISCRLRPTPTAIDETIRRVNLDDGFDLYPTGQRLARLLNVHAIERRESRAFQLGAVDETRDQRAEATKARKREADRARKANVRRSNGAKTRAEFIQQSASNRKPWVADAVSRATWYRNKGARPIRAPRV